MPRRVSSALPTGSSSRRSSRISERIEHGQLPPELSGANGSAELGEGATRRERRRRRVASVPRFRAERATAIGAARGDHRRLPASRAGVRAVSASARRACPRIIATEAQAMATQARRNAAREAYGRRRRRADPRVLAVEPGRRRADVPRRSAAAHSRSRDPRRADPRQDQQGRLALAHRPGAVAVRERGDVGPDDHRQAGDDEQRNGAVVGVDAFDRHAAASR